MYKLINIFDELGYKSNIFKEKTKFFFFPDT